MCNYSLQSPWYTTSMCGLHNIAYCNARIYVYVYNLYIALAYRRKELVFKQGLKIVVIKPMSYTLDSSGCYTEAHTVIGYIPLIHVDKL